MEQQNLNLVDISPAAAEPSVVDPWSSLAPLAPDSKRMARQRIVSLRRSDPSHVAFDILRTRILKVFRENRWSSLAITSPTAACGKTTIALNLALSLAREHNLRTVLLDLDLRRPRLAQLLGASPPYSIRQFLEGECRIEEFLMRQGDGLAIGASTEAVEHPAELLHDQRTGWALKRLRQTLQPDVILYDLPPMLAADDVAGFLPNADAALLVVAAEASTTAEIDACEQELSSQSKLVGVVLNKVRFAVHPGYGYSG